MVFSVRRCARRFRRGLHRGWHFRDMTRACSTRSSGHAAGNSGNTAWLLVSRVIDRQWLGGCVPSCACSSDRGPRV